MVKIILTKDGYIDFKQPIYMSDEQIKRFTEFMKTLFPEITIAEIEEPINPREGGSESRSWSIDEYVLLLSSEDNKSIANKTKRTVMSIEIKRGEFVPEFMVWAKKKGYVYSPSNVDKEMVREFLNERGL